MSTHSEAGPDQPTARSVPTGYGVLYAPVVPLGFALTFAPLFQDTNRDGLHRHWDSLWQLAGEPQGGSALLGLIIVFALAGLIVATVFRPPPTPVLPASIAILALIALLMVATKPDTGSPKPPFSTAGHMMLGVAIYALALAVSHIVHLVVVGRSVPTERE